jgi:Flp pilus assembly protein TadD
MAETSSADDIAAEADAAIRAGEVPRATALAQAALDRGLEHPLLLNLRAFALERSGHAHKALADLERARELAPRDPFILNALAECLSRLDRQAEAVAAAEAALKLNPEYARARYTKGLAYEMLGELSLAERCFQQTVLLEAGFADAHARLAAIASRRSDWDDCRKFADRALLTDPGNSIALFALAAADIATGALEEAEQRLRTVLDDARMSAHERANAMSLLGDVRDRQGRIAEAFALYEKANLELQSFFAPIFAVPKTESTQALIARLTDTFVTAPAWASPARLPKAQNDHSAGHVFIVGFPRSGTTLLGQILAAHPRAATVDEKAPLIDAIRDFIDDPSGIDRLATLSDAEIMRYREAYWRNVRNFEMHVRDKVFVDKLPLNLLRLPLLGRIFPEAKILLAIRDPRDVVFSCFRRLFAMHQFTYELLTLPGAAQSYARAMRLVEVFREKLPLNLLGVRNEDIVEDFDLRVREICDFVGLEWKDSLRGFAEKSRRQQIATPSATQVARGLSREGVGQWRRYAEQLAPVLPLLRPWVEKFGYPPE